MKPIRKYQLSVCIPCYNEQKFIKDAIESVLSQDFRDYKLIIVDDGSLDKTVDIARSFRDPRIKIIVNKKNLGLYMNLTKCLQLSKTKYIKILCADDVLEKGSLRKQINILKTNRNISLVFGGSSVIGGDGKPIFNRYPFSSDLTIKGGDLIRKSIIKARNLIGEPSGVMFRGDIAKKMKLKFYGGTYRHMADLNFWFDLLKYGNAYYINSKIFSFRVHAKGGTTNLIKKNISEHLSLYDKYNKVYTFSFKERVIFLLNLYFNFFTKYIFLWVFAR